MTESEYRDLRPGYDPGPPVDHVPTSTLHAYLGVDEKIAFLKDYPLPAGASMLDVGCGGGGFLLAGKALGLHAVGIEPSEDHSLIARKLGLDVISGYFSPEPFLGKTFDLVIVSHVIEHIYNPKEFIADLLKVVKSGGLLVMVTPNAEGLACKVSGKYWPMLKPIDHVSMLGPSALPFLSPENAVTSWRTSEYTGEVLTTFLVSVRDAIRERVRGAAPAENVSCRASVFSADVAKKESLRDRAIRIASAPIHAVTVRQKKQACLIIEMRKKI